MVKNKRQLPLCIMLICCMILLTMPAKAAIKKSDETSLRAAVILGILRFTEWSVEQTSANTINLCHIGSPTSLDKLYQAHNSVQIKGKTVLITPYDINAENNKQACHIALIGPDVDDILAIKYQPTVLTICDDCKQANSAVINLHETNNRIGFDVNLTQLNNKKITVSSSLLELATRVDK